MSITYSYEVDDFDEQDYSQEIIEVVKSSSLNILDPNDKVSIQLHDYRFTIYNHISLNAGKQAEFYFTKYNDEYRHIGSDKIVIYRAHSFIQFLVEHYDTDDLIYREVPKSNEWNFTLKCRRSKLFIKIIHN